MILNTATGTDFDILRGYPPEVPKNRSQKKRATGLKFQANGSKMAPQIARLAIFLVILFDFFPHRFWDELLIGFSMVLGYIFAYFSCFIWMSSGIFLKPATLAKSAPRPHGSMVFEVLTLRFLMVFS